MIILSLLNELLCGLCWGLTIRMILIRHVKNNQIMVRLNVFVLFLMLINLIFILPLLVFFYDSLTVERFFQKLDLVVTIIDVLSTVGLMVFCLISFSTRWRRWPSAVKNIVVLGAAIRNGQVSTILRTRLNAAVRCWKKHPSAVIIVTGGRPSTGKVTEAEVMTNYLIQKGVPLTNIVQENQAHNTRQNLAYTKDLIDPNTPTVVVTSDFHILRASTYARQLGLRWKFLGARTPWRYVPLTFIRDYLGIIRDHRWTAGGIVLILIIFALIGIK